MMKLNLIEKYVCEMRLNAVKMHLIGWLADVWHGTVDAPEKFNPLEIWKIK